MFDKLKTSKKLTVISIIGYMLIPISIILYSLYMNLGTKRPSPFAPEPTGYPMSRNQIDTSKYFDTPPDSRPSVPVASTYHYQLQPRPMQQTSIVEPIKPPKQDPPERKHEEPKADTEPSPETVPDNQNPASPPTQEDQSPADTVPQQNLHTN